MNKLFYPFLEKFVVVYLDDIVVYSHTLKEHVLHLKEVFQVLRDNELYVKLEKCSFAQDEVVFLGHNIKDGGLMMDGRRFIMGYSAIASPLTELLKKSKAWIRDEEYQAAFESLKKAVMEEPVLRLPDETIPFELHTDALNFAIGGVLMMRDDVETFVRTCLICQQDKIEQKKLGGLLDPLPTPKGPWESVSMDFIICLPKSEGGGSIIVVVDLFSKYGTFIAAPPDVTTDDTAKLFFKNVVKYWGVQHVIFSSLNGRENGKGECTIGALSSALWEGGHPLTPNALAASYEGSSSATYKTIKVWHKQADLARALLDKAAKKMKKWEDERRGHVEFEVGDQVMVKLLPQQFKSLRKVYK
ncbi:Toll/interleukin-1 receptor domain-containing protein [Tanacetum coccineum]